METFVIITFVAVNAFILCSIIWRIREWQKTECKRWNSVDGEFADKCLKDIREKLKAMEP